MDELTSTVKMYLERNSLSSVPLTVSTPDVRSIEKVTASFAGTTAQIALVIRYDHTLVVAYMMQWSRKQVLQHSQD
jgi:hypothetical protein